MSSHMLTILVNLIHKDYFDSVFMSFLKWNGLEK